jgi:hypothetical protein
VSATSPDADAALGRTDVPASGLAMTPPAVHPDVSLGAWLAAHARDVSDRRLALDVGAGALATLLLTLWRPPGRSVLLAAALCFVAFGVWATAARQLATADAWDATAGRVAVWRLVRAAAGVAGVLAAALAGFGLVFGVIGRVIS